MVQLCIRKKTGPWREGGASLLAGAIIAGVPTGVLVLILSHYFSTHEWYWKDVANAQWILQNGFTAGLVLAFSGGVQLCARKKTGPSKEWDAGLVAGTIIAGVSISVMAVIL